MAFAAANLVLISGGPNGNLVYSYDAGSSDSMATVAASGYFNNTDDVINLTADDVIIALCSDGVITLVVTSISSGAVTTTPVNSDGPWNDDISTASQAMSLGLSEIGTGTATAFALPTPSVGAKINIFQSGTGTAKTVAVSSSGVTLDDPGNTTITLTGGAIANVALLGVSTSRWAVVGGSGFTLS